MPSSAHLCAPCDVISTKTMLPSGRTHHQLHSVKFEVNWTDGSQDTAIFVSYLLPGFPDLTIIRPSSI